MPSSLNAILGGRGVRRARRRAPAGQASGSASPGSLRGSYAAGRGQAQQAGSPGAVNTAAIGSKMRAPFSYQQDHLHTAPYLQTALAEAHAPVPGLDPSQSDVLSKILAEGQRLGVSPKLALSAIETGLVESHLTEIPGGDADSQNWRQERASGYADDWAKTGGPLNTSASARRFFTEAQGFDAPGKSAGQVAADTQRPREDLRGRYDQEQGAAQAILGASGKRGAAQQVLSKLGLSGKQAQPAQPQFAGGGKGPYSFFLPKNAKFSSGRTDMGWDVDGEPGTPVLAMGDAEVTGVTGSASGFGGYVTYKLTSGPLAGHSIFYGHAEPLVQPGQKLKKGDPVSRLSSGSFTGTGGPGHLEAGFAGRTPLTTLAVQKGTESVKDSPGGTPQGRRFQAFAEQLKAGTFTGALPPAGAGSIGGGMVSGGSVPSGSGDPAQDESAPPMVGPPAFRPSSGIGAVAATPGDLGSIQDSLAALLSGSDTSQDPNATTLQTILGKRRYRPRR